MVPDGTRLPFATPYAVTDWRALLLRRTLRACAGVRVAVVLRACLRLRVRVVLVRFRRAFR